MNDIDTQLRRLFRAAARAPRELPAEAPFHLEARVLANWRSGRPFPDDLPGLWMGVVQKAFVCSCAILLVAAALILHSRSESPANEMVDLDSAIQLTLLQ